MNLYMFSFKSLIVQDLEKNLDLFLYQSVKKIQFSKWFLINGTSQNILQSYFLNKLNIF